MKLNISYPATGCQKLIEIDDEKKIRMFYDKRMGHEVDADGLGDEWKGYVVRISGGNDKQGFPMKQGVLTTARVRLLLSKGHSCYRPRRTGERKRKSVRGCIVDSNLSVLCLVIIKKGEQDIPGLTDKTIPRRLGPKRASKIRKLFNLAKEDDVRRYVVKRPLPKKEGKRLRTKGPKIQRLVTPMMLQRKRHRLALKRKRSQKRKDDAADYARLLSQRAKEARAKRVEEVRRRRTASQRESQSSEGRKSESKDTSEGEKISAAKKAEGEKKRALKKVVKAGKRKGNLKKRIKSSGGKKVLKSSEGGKKVLKSSEGGKKSALKKEAKPSEGGKKSASKKDSKPSQGGKKGASKKESKPSGGGKKS